MTKTNDFNKAFLTPCEFNKNNIKYLFQKCWKCKIKKRVKTISEAKLLIPFKHLL